VIADDQAIRRNIKREAGPRSRFSSRADATKAGVREAAKVRGLLDGHHPKKLAAELGKAESSLADPDFAAGFFKGLGSKGTFDLLTAARGQGLLVAGRALALAQEHKKLPESFFEGIVDAAKRQAAALYAYEHGGGAIDIRDRRNYALHKYENGITAPPGAYDFLDTIAPPRHSWRRAPRSQSWAAPSPEAEVSTVEGHLSAIDAIQLPENQALFDRIRTANASGRALTVAEENFLRHELVEKELMDAGFPQEGAHMLAGLTHPTFANYDPEVIAAYPDRFNDAWKAYWGIK